MVKHYKHTRNLITHHSCKVFRTKQKIVIEKAHKKMKIMVQTFRMNTIHQNKKREKKG
jgi:hypothetical protein